MVTGRDPCLTGMTWLIHMVLFVLLQELTPRRQRSIQVPVQPQNKPWCLTIHVTEVMKDRTTLKTPWRCAACVADTPHAGLAAWINPELALSPETTPGLTHQPCTEAQAPCSFHPSIHSMAENTAAMETVRQLPAHLKRLYSCLIQFVTDTVSN